MKPLHTILFAAAVCAAVVPLHARIERTVEKSFNVSGSGTLKLETNGGTINVVPGSAGIVKITAHERIRANSDAEADELLKKLDLKFDQDGNNVSASAKYDQVMGFRFGGTPVQVDFTAEVPASFAADLHSSGGGISVTDLSGAVYARTSGGNIKLGNVGGKVDAHTSGGSISLDEAKAEVKLGTSGGNISVGHVAGPAELSTSGGSISVKSVEERLQAKTSGGSIRAGIAGQLKGDCLLSTSGGSVHVTVDKKAAFQLDAETSGGTVNAEGLALQAAHQPRNHLTGPVNGGGQLLKLRTSGGSIHVSTE